MGMGFRNIFLMVPKARFELPRTLPHDSYLIMIPKSCSSMLAYFGEYMIKNEGEITISYEDPPSLACNPVHSP